MPTAILVYYLSALASGSAGIVTALLLHFRSKSRLTRWYVVLLFSATLYIVLLNMHYFQRTYASRDSSFLRLAAIIVASLCLGLFCPLLGYMIHDFLGLTMPRRRALLFGACGALPLLFNLLSMDSDYFPRGPVSILPGLTVYGAILYCVVLVLARRRGQENPLRRAIARTFVTLALLFVPLQAIDEATMLLGRRQYPISVIPLFYLLWNAASAFFSIRYLLERQRAAPESVPVVVRGLDARFVEMYGLSPRECELVPLILKGLANKAIAFELGITFSTVKNHVHNIFTKTGARSRIELLRLVSGRD